MDKKINWGILGYAGISYKKVIPAILNVECANLYGIASRSEEKLKQATDLFPFQKTYTSYDALLEDKDIDAVYIPLPNSMHKEWTIKAARAGKHILCEKPLALTKSDAKEMFDVCDENGVKLMEAFMYRFSSRSKKAKELVDSGIIGEIKHINSSHRFLLKDYTNVRVNEALGGGSIRDVGCYPISMVSMLLDDFPQQISAFKTVLQGVDFTLSALLKYKSGVMASIHSGFDSIARQITEINGTLGTMIIRDSFTDTNDVYTPIQVFLQDGTQKEYEVLPYRQYEAEIEELSMCILENTQPFIEARESIRTVELMQKILESAI